MVDAMESTQLRFLNHACFKITCRETTVSCDPWLFGSAFNNGWRLLVEDETLASVAASSKFIWLSHEHPDHFSIEFFKRYQPRQSKILFQRTHDQRVISYFRNSGYEAIEIGPSDAYKLSADESLTVGRCGFYDSWSLYRNKSHSILDLNDCDFADAKELEKLARRVGPIDVLLTQFSYAAWKGGRANVDLRRRSAAQKLEAVVKQVRAIRPRFIIPFASFIYFSHQENSYLNDSVNTIDSVRSAIAGSGSVAILMSPGDCWEVGSLWDNEPAIAFWQRTYSNIARLPLQQPGPIVPMGVLGENFGSYRRRLGKNNSLTAMHLLALLPGLGAFKPFKIRLIDHDKVYQFSLWDGLREVADDAGYDVAMTSENLNFIFLNEFGYDTLTVNGRFEASADGFRAMTKNFAIGSLNSMGLSLSFAFLKDLDVAWLLMRRLSRFSKRLG